MPPEQETLQLLPVNYHQLVTSTLCIKVSEVGGGGVHFKP